MVLDHANSSEMDSENVLRGAVEAITRDVRSVRPDVEDIFFLELQSELTNEWDGNMVDLFFGKVGKTDSR